MTSIVGYSVCLGLFIFTSYLNNVVQVKYKMKFDQSLKEDYFDSIVNMKYEEFSKKKIGEYISFQANDITAIGDDYLNPLVAIVTQSIRIGTYFVVISIALDIKVSIILTGASFLGVILPKRLGVETARRRKKYLEHQKGYYSKIEELLNGFKTINHRTRKNIKSNHKKSLQDVVSERYKYGKANSRMWSLNGLGSESINYIIFLYLGYLAINGDISAAFAVATFQYAQGLSEPVHEMLYYLSMIHSSKDLVKSYLDFVNLKDLDEQKEHVELANELTVKKLGKSFDDFKLNEMNITFEKNKKYAVIGMNGSGKSTFFNILSSHLNEYEGEILVDGKNIKDIESSYLIGTLEQDEYIFSDNFIDNVTVFDSYENKVNDVFFDEANILRNQENCKKLSGGEKKMVGLVRLLNKNTPIILLDEPFSAVDNSKKEGLLNKLLAIDKTMIMITHDIDESLSKFDKVLFMDKGKLIYELPYQELKETQEYKVLEQSISVAT